MTNDRNNAFAAMLAADKATDDLDTSTKAKADTPAPKPRSPKPKTKTPKPKPKAPKPRKPKEELLSTNLTIRVDPAQSEALDRIAADLAATDPLGRALTRSDIARAALAKFIAEHDGGAA